MRHALQAAICGLATLITAPALAVPVTYEFSGVINGPRDSGNYYHDFGAPFGTSFSGYVTLESDTAPYYEDATQRNFYDLVTSFEVQIGAGGANGTYTGPGGLQVPPPSGWNSSSMGISTGSYSDGTPYDQVAMYGSIIERPADATNAYYRFELWGVSSLNVFDTFPALDDLPGEEAFGGTMGFNLVATQYDDAGTWLGQTQGISVLHGGSGDWRCRSA